MLDFQLFGPFGLVDENAVDRRPKLMKSRAVLCALAAAPRHCRSRSWLQSLLWEDRQPEQAQSSLRSALSDIRRHLGPYAGAFLTSHTEVALDPALISVDLNRETSATRALFLEGFDIAHAQNFEDWLREMRTSFETRSPCKAAPPPASAVTRNNEGCSLYLAARGDVPSTFTRMQCDTLVDCLAKSSEDLSIADIVDGRGTGTSIGDFQRDATAAQCSMILVSETVEANAGVMARLKVIDTETAHLIWSTSVTGRPAIELEDPATIGVVAEFIDFMSARLVRSYDWHSDQISPQLMAAAGINHIFKLGSQNFETAEVLFKRLYEHDPRGRYLAWRAYLRTFLLGELEFGDREAVIEEGTALARRALEKEPHNSVVLALCAHVENMLHDDYGNAFDLSARALEINRCNPLAWASLGTAAAFLGKGDDGYQITRVGAKLASGTCFSFQTESWASAAGMIAGNFNAARAHAERSHQKAATFAPPLRYLSALYCENGAFAKARDIANKLRVREPGFSLDSLKDDGYPADSLRRGKLLSALPVREI